MCAIARWRNVCSQCQDEEKLRRIEYGWCSEALHIRRRFGGCGNVVESEVQYAGTLKNLNSRPGLATTPEKYPFIQYYK